MGSPLDNAVWHAITGPHAALAERDGSAGRFFSEVSPFSAVADASSPESWADLARVVGPGRRAVLFLPALQAPDGWVEESRVPCVQLVADRCETSGAPNDFVDLGPDDVPEMLRLVEATRPGPFGRRTVELGGYLGHRVEGRLVAMAGERLRCDTYTEVSAVCTEPAMRGTGLATRLVHAVVDRIRARGDEAFLHVATTNASALRLYLALGFVRRTDADAVVLRCERS